MRTTNRTEILTIRISPENLRAAKIVAQVTCRTLSSLAEYALVLYIKKNYPESLQPGAKCGVILDEAPREGEA